MPLTGNYLTWPDEFGGSPVSCCVSAAPCVFHQQFPAAIRSPLRSQDNAQLAAGPQAPTVIITPPIVPPPAPADPPADPAPATS